MLRSAIKFALTSVTGTVAAIAIVLGGNYWTYSRLTHEVEVGVIAFERQGDGYLASFVTGNNDPQYFVLKGDEWQLDTRLIKWKSWATLLGKDTLYQLDRISGRYRDARKAREELPSLADLGGPGLLDLWTLARDYPDVFFMVDAQYGSSVFLPMEDGVSYRISMSNTGVLARRIEEAL